MKSSILDGKRIIAVDDEADILTLLEEEIRGSCPNCAFEKEATFESAFKKLESGTYDLVILDIMGVQGFDLLSLAVRRGFRVAMLTAHALSPENLKRAFEMKAMSYLPKEKLGEIVPFLENAVRDDYLSGWKRLMDKLKGFLDAKFGSDWEKKAGLPWQE